MEVAVDLTIQEIVISDDGQVRLSYIFSIETPEFSGPVAGGQSLASDPDVLSKAKDLVDAARLAALRELGLADKTKEEPLDPTIDEDPL